MDKDVSLVRVDTRSYRVIARDNWGLTSRQMKGMHVHHRIKVSEGGTNDPSNLYVCSPSMHRWVWHDGEEWVEWATEGGRKGGQKGGPETLKRKMGLFARTPDQVKSDAQKAGAVGSRSQISQKVGMFAPGFFQTEEHRSRGRKVGKETAERTSKPVTVVFPDESELSFPSLHSAARRLGLNRLALTRLAESGRTGHKRPYRGMRVYFSPGSL